jgi:1-aminocyclopropane-1-carboxylate deaminase/D-cysteine desulfhydrase-like pyridoxal-dependent ACC family enzyme
MKSMLICSITVAITYYADTISTYTDIQSSYDLTSDHSPIIATISTSVICQKTNSSLAQLKNWDTYRCTIQDKVNLSMKLKEQEDVELETVYSVHSSMLLKKLPQTAIPKERQLTYPTK